MYKNNKILQTGYIISPQFIKNGVAGIYSILVSGKKFGDSFKYWADMLRESQFYDPVQLESFQLKLLNEFYKEAIINSEFYRNLVFLNELVLDSLTDLREIRKFPVINKTIVKDNYAGILNINKAKYKFSSSGTTGTSLNVWLDKEAYQREYAFRWHYLGMAGAQRKDRFAFFLGNNLHPVEKKNPPFHLIDPYEKSIFFSLFHMADSTLKHYVEAYNLFEPSYIKGYPSGLFIFAQFIKKYGYRIYKPRAIYSASETLHEFQKKMIEDVFQCPVYQWYGQVETTVNIHECEHRRLHVKEEYGLLELLNENGADALPGQVATAIGTGWGNKAFPLIRYNTGDNMILANVQTCPCGRNGRIIEKILGRDEDFIITSEGRRIGRLDFIFKPVNAVKEGQIIQESLLDITIKVVPLPEFSVKDEELIKKMFKKYVGDSFKVRIESVKSIERSSNGKIRYVISKVKQPKTL